MYMLVYVSSATKLFSDEELHELLSISRKNNSARDITGLLLYKDGNFMQFLEGPKEQVVALVEKIKHDRRHGGIIVMLQEEHERREFEDWSMAFRKLDSDTAAEVPGYSPFLDLPLTSEDFLLHPTKSLQLLFSFKASMR